MKKLIFLTLTFFLMSLLINVKPCFSNLIFNSYYITNGTYTFYCKDYYEKIDNAKVIKNGNSSIIKTSFKNAKNVRKNIENVLGESLTFDGNLFDFIKIQNELNLKYSFQENLSEKLICVYGFSENDELKSRSVEIDNKKINVQIAYNNGTITIGNPIILGSF